MASAAYLQHSVACVCSQISHLEGITSSSLGAVLVTAVAFRKGVPSTSFTATAKYSSPNKSPSLAGGGGDVQHTSSDCPACSESIRQCWNIAFLFRQVGSGIDQCREIVSFRVAKLLLTL